MAVLAMALVIVFAGLIRAQTNPGGAAYKPVEITSAGDIAYPPNTAVTGLVALDVSVDTSGNVKDVKVLQDVPPLTHAALTAVKKWSFRAAQLNGSPVAGRIRVHVVFDPYNPGGVGIPSGGLQPEEPTDGARRYVPPRVTAANYAIYPVNTAVGGTVVLHVLVGKDGKAEEQKVVYGVEPLRTAAIEAVKSWKFASATYEGKTARSTVVVTFVFPSAAFARP